jgi:hypothetical protein
MLMMAKIGKIESLEKLTRAETRDYWQAITP